MDWRNVQQHRGNIEDLHLRNVQKHRANFQRLANMWTYVCPGAGSVTALQPALAYAASDSVAHKVSRTVEGRLVIGTTHPGKTWALSYFNRLTFWNDVFLFFWCICCARRLANVSRVDKLERECPHFSTEQSAKKNRKEFTSICKFENEVTACFCTGSGT